MMDPESVEPIAKILIALVASFFLALGVVLGGLLI